MTKKILMLVLLLAPMSLFAQKFATFNYGDVMQSLPGYRAAYTELQAVSKQYDDSLEEMAKEYQTKLEKYRKEITDETLPVIRQRAEQELQQLQERFQQAQQDNANALSQQQSQKMQPLVQRVLDAVNALATEGGYTYILDRSAAQQAGIFINESLSEDVTKKIQDKLGVTAADIQAGKAFAAQLQQDAQRQQQQQGKR